MVETLYMVGCLPHSFFTDHHAWFSTTHFTVIISVCVLCCYARGHKSKLLQPRGVQLVLGAVFSLVFNLDLSLSLSLSLSLVGLC